MDESVELDGHTLRVTHTYVNYTYPFEAPAHATAQEAVLKRWEEQLGVRGLVSDSAVSVRSFGGPARYVARGEIRLLGQTRRESFRAEAAKVRLPTPRVPVDPTDMNPCAITELPRTMCAHCKGLPDLPTDRHEAAASWQAQPDRACGTAFPAKYPGTCYTCDTSFWPGQTIHAAGSTAGKIDYVCHACAW